MLDEKLYKELVQWAHDSQIALYTFRQFIPDVPSDHEGVLRIKIDKTISALDALESIAQHGLVTRYLVLTQASKAEPNA